MCNTPSPTPLGVRSVKSSGVQRRTIIKATAAFGAMAASGGIIANRSAAQGSTSRSNEWQETMSTSADGRATTFATDYPFTAVAPHWNGDTDFPAAVEMSLSEDGERFSEPVIVGPSMTDAGPPDRENRVFGDLLLTQGASHVRYRSLDADGNAVDIPGLTFTYIDASDGPKLEDVEKPQFYVRATQPPIVSRKEWGAGLAYGGEDRGKDEWPPYYQTVRHVIIHHSETPRFRDPLVEIRSIHYYHAITRGWGDIGYNYLVDFMGNVYEGRVGGENVVGGHAFQYANGSAGICCMGNFSMENATPEALAGLIWITAWASRKLDPLGREDFHEVPNLPTICAHRDVWDSACPGDGLYADVDAMRSAVADVLAEGARLPDPGYTQGDFVEVDVGEANLRNGPGTDFGTNVKLPRGTVMEVVDGPTTASGYTWYRLRGSPGEGWAATTVLSPSNRKPRASFRSGQRVFVNTTRLNLRDRPSLGGRVRAAMPDKAAATITTGPRQANGFTWYGIQGDYGKGWVVEQYLSASAGGVRAKFERGDIVQVATDGLNLRSAASGYAGVVAQLDRGAEASVVGGPRTADGYVWVQLESSNGSGWAADRFLRSGSGRGAQTGRFKRGQSLIVTTDNLNLRTRPGTSAAVIITLPNGTAGEVVDGPRKANGYTWYRLSTYEGNGWAVESYLTPGTATRTSGELGVGDRVMIDTDSLNLRSAPDARGRVLTVLTWGKSGSIVDGPKRADETVWYRVKSSEGTGWCVGRYLAKISGSQVVAASSSANRRGDVVAVDIDSLRIRSAPKLNARIVATLPIGRKGTVVDGPRSADGYDWLKIATNDGEGWCVAYYLRRISRGGQPIGSRVRVIGGELNLRSGPGTGRGVKAVLPDGAVLEVVEGERRANGTAWWKVSSSRYGTGWVVARYLASA